MRHASCMCMMRITSYAHYVSHNSGTSFAFVIVVVVVVVVIVLVVFHSFSA